MDRSKSILILCMIWLSTIDLAKTTLTLDLVIQITKAMSMADTNGLLLAWATCLTGSARAATSTTPLKAVLIQPMLLPRRKLEKARGMRAEKGLLRTVIFG